MLLKKNPPRVNPKYRNPGWPAQGVFPKVGKQAANESSSRNDNDDRMIISSRSKANVDLIISVGQARMTASLTILIRVRCYVIHV